MPAATGYSVSTLNDLKAIDATVRTDRYIRAVKETYSWYMFIASATDTDDGVNYIAPTTGSGRWYRMRSMILSSEITDLAEYIQDTIGSAFQDSTTIDFTYNDSLNRFTVDVISGGLSNVHIASNADITIGKIAGLQNALDGKSPISHTHTSGNISDFQEAVLDYVAGALASSNITINYDDVAGVIELTATVSGGGGGSVDWDTIDDDTWDGLYAI